MIHWNLIYASVFSRGNYLWSATKMSSTLLTLALPRRPARVPNAGMHMAE
jgi:hypothetical protein